MHIFVEIRNMDHGLNIEQNENIKILRPGSYWQEFTVSQIFFFDLLLKIINKNHVFYTKLYRKITS